ncbi:TIGR00296 family protein [Hydrogenivirga sp.]
MLSLEDAKKLIVLGRNAVLGVFAGEEIELPESLKEEFSDKRGVFTTLLTYPDRELRGCIGVPYPVYPLWYGVIYSSVSAAFRDPRFPPLQREELNRVVWELSVLTPPEEVPKEKLPEAVCVGRDGLIVELGGAKGLLLPQVAPRYGWSPVEFLEHTCLKAGLDRDCWKDPEARVFRFESEVFEEVEPWGEVMKVEGKSCR